MTDQEKKLQKRDENVRWVLRDAGEIVALRLAPADQPPGGAWENIGPPDGRGLKDGENGPDRPQKYQEPDEGRGDRSIHAVVAVAIVALVAALVISVFGGAGG